MICRLHWGSQLFWSSPPNKEHCWILLFTGNNWQHFAEIILSLIWKFALPSGFYCIWRQLIWSSCPEDLQGNMAQEKTKKIVSILFSVCCDNDFGENVWWLTLVSSGMGHAWERCLWKLFQCERAFPGNTHFVTLSYIFCSTAKDERLAKYKYKLTTSCPLEKWGMNSEKLFPLNNVLWKCVIFKTKANVTSKQPEINSFTTWRSPWSWEFLLSGTCGYLFLLVCLSCWRSFWIPGLGRQELFHSWALSDVYWEIFPNFLAMESETRFLVHRVFYTVEITTLWHRLLRSEWAGVLGLLRYQWLEWHQVWFLCF